MMRRQVVKRSGTKHLGDTINVQVKFVGDVLKCLLTFKADVRC